MGLEVGQEMACGREVNGRKGGRVLAIAVLVFLFVSNVTQAAPPKPSLGLVDWSTGAIEIVWSNVIPGNKINLYVSSVDSEGEFVLYDSWIANTESGSRYVEPLDNGKTYWFYITQEDETGESEKSSTHKQTPPVTVFVINWQEWLAEIANSINVGNQYLTQQIEQIFMPSQAALDDLFVAIDELKDAVGFGQAEGIGGGMIDEFDDVKAGLKPPAVIDDGENTFTGGKSGSNSPFNSGLINDPEGGINLEVPDLTSGTDTDLTFTLPITVKPDGSFFEIKLFTEEQLDKLMWMGLLRNLSVAAIWIVFGIWIVQRLTPVLKS